MKIWVIVESRQSPAGIKEKLVSAHHAKAEAAAWALQLLAAAKTLEINRTYSVVPVEYEEKK